MLLNPGILECVRGARLGTVIALVTFRRRRLSCKDPQMGQVPDRGVAWMGVHTITSTWLVRGGSEEAGSSPPGSLSDL